MKVDLENREVFARFSSLYEKARVGYPEQLIDDILDFSKINKKARVLDVGCGTGQATALFANRGFEVVGLDISEEMIKVANEKFSSHKNISLKAGTLEDFEHNKKFDIVASGMAWHWINPKTRCEKAHNLLKRNGTLALFWSYQNKEKSSFVNEINNITNSFGSTNKGPTGSSVKEISEDVFMELIKSRLFSAVGSRIYEENKELSRQAYVNLVLSYGWAQSLPDEKRGGLAKELLTACKKYKEPLTVPYKYLLILGKRN